jgi:MFS family permease
VGGQPAVPSRSPKSPRASFRPLRHRNFALFFWANLVSNVGTWMQTVAVGALVTARTGKASWAALAAAAMFLPVGLLSPVGGALADRLDRRRWLALGNLLQAALAAVLVVLAATGRASPAAVTAVVFLSGCVLALLIPFQQAMVPDLVPAEDVLGAAALGAAQYNLGRVVGPALAGVVIAASSYTVAFAINAVSFFAVVAALVVMRLEVRPRTDRHSGLWSQIREGARAAWAQPGCRAAIGLIALAAFLAAPFIALIPAKALDLVGPNEEATGAATGALTTAQGVGAVVGALILAPLAERFGRHRVVVFDLVATPVALCLYALSPSVITAVVALALVGATYIGILSGLNTVVQLRAPSDLRARVLSLYLTALGVIYPIGALAQGAVADVSTLAGATIGAAVIMIVAVGLVAFLSPETLRSLGDRRTEPAVAKGSTATTPT